MRSQDKRKKITVVAPFTITPAFFGGQLRIHNLYCNISKWVDVEIISQGNRRSMSTIHNIWEGIKEIEIGKSNNQIEEEKKWGKKYGNNCWDICMIEMCTLTQEFIDAIRESAKDSECVFVSHPYSIYAVWEAVSDLDIPIIYDSHNVEYLLKQKMIKGEDYEEEILDKLYKAESMVCTKSSLIFACSQEDAEKMCELYNINEEKVIVVPNGVNARIKELFNLNVKKTSKPVTALFIGSYHAPNLIAVKHIIELAYKLPEIKFIIAGPCGDCWKEETPENVEILGGIDDTKKNELLLSVDIALNPMPYGSGTNLKMLEYFAFEIPTITTTVGARGLGITDKKEAIICEMHDFEEALLYFLGMKDEEKKNMINHALRIVQDKFDWEKIADNCISEVIEKGLISNVSKSQSYYNFIEYEKEKQRKSSHNNFVNRKVYIWGAGDGGRRTKKYLDEKNIQVLGFIDSDKNKENSIIDGVKIYLPEKILFDDEKVYVIIASVYSDEIRKFLDKSGYKYEEDYIEQDVSKKFLFLY